MLSRFHLLFLVISLAGCGSENIDIQTDKADKQPKSSLASLTLGESLSGTVKAVSSHAPDAEEQQETIFTAKITLNAGQTVAVTMQAKGESFDSYMFVREVSGNEEVSSNDNQAILGSLGAKDSIVVFSAEKKTDFVVFAQGGYSRTYAGDFTLHPILLASNPLIDISMERTSISSKSEQLNVLETLIHDEAAIIDYLEKGWIQETASGSLEVVALQKIPLRSRNSVGQLVESTNQNRDKLVDEVFKNATNSEKNSVRKTLGLLYQGIHN